MANLKDKYCRGEHNIFRKECTHFDEITEECGLLVKQQPLWIIFAHGWCQPFDNLLKAAAIGQLLKYQDILPIKDFLDSVVFEIEKKLKNKSLTEADTYTIRVLNDYINVSVKNKVYELARKFGGNKKFTCGRCVHLSRSKPFYCSRITIINTDGIEQKNPYYQQQRKPSNKACKDGFESYLLSSYPEEDIFESPKRSSSNAKIFLEQVQQILIKKAATQPIYAKKLFIFRRLMFYIEQQLSHSEAVNMLIEQDGIRRATVYRLIREMKEEFWE